MRATIEAGDRDALLAEGRTFSMKIGPYGAQDVLAGQLLAGYTQTRRPEVGRVCAWLQVIRSDHLDFLRFYELRNRPGRVAELLADHTDGCTWVTLDAERFDRGVKLRPPTDPVLAGLAGFVTARSNFGAHGVDGQDGIDAATTAALHESLAVVVPHLERAAWYDVITEFAQIVAVAVEHGRGLSVG